MARAYHAQRRGQQPLARVVMHTIGTDPNFQVTERKEPAQDGDVYLLCSSPLAFVLSSQDIGAVLAQNELSARSMAGSS